MGVGPCGNLESDSCLSRGSAEGGRRRCRPSPSPGEPGGAAGRSLALRGTFCSRRPGDRERGGGSEPHPCGRSLPPSPTPRSYLPLGVVVLVQGAGVCPREDDQAAVLSVHLLHRSPGAHDLVNGTEREVVQILVHRVARCLLTYGATHGQPKSQHLHFCQPKSTSKYCR